MHCLQYWIRTSYFFGAWHSSWTLSPFSYGNTDAWLLFTTENTDTYSLILCLLWYFTPFLCLTLPQRPRVIRSSCQHRKKQDNIKTKQFLCRIVLTVASTNPFSAIPPLGTAGVSWWTLDVLYLAHPQGNTRNKGFCAIFFFFFTVQLLGYYFYSAFVRE